MNDPRSVTSTFSKILQRVLLLYKQVTTGGVSLMIPLIFTATLLTIGLYFVVRPYVLSPLRHIPGPSFLQGHLLWGQYPTILRAEAGKLQRAWVTQYGSVVRAVGPLGLERLVFASTDGLRTILAENSRHFEKPRFVQQILGITTGPSGLLAAIGSDHKRLRDFFSPAFSKLHIMQGQEAIFHRVNTFSETLLLELQNVEGYERVVDLYPRISRLALDVVASASFGLDPQSLAGDWNAMVCAYHAVLAFQSGTNITKFTGLLFLPGAYRFLRSNLCYKLVKFSERWILSWLPALEPVYVTVKSMRTIRNTAERIIRQRLNLSEDVEDQSPLRSDLLLQYILRSGISSQDGSVLKTSATPDIDFMVDQVLAFLGAGHETIAGALSWTLWLLASHPAAQDKLREEISLRSVDTDPHQSRVQSLPYLSAVIHESLRLFPPIPSSFREALVDTWVDGVFVPKGTMLYIGIRMMNTLEAYWGKDSEEFRPERWLDDSDSDKPPMFDPTKPMGKENFIAFQSFLFGSHACMGRQMAMIELRIMLISLVRDFSFSPSYPGQIAKPTTGVTMVPSDQLPLLVGAIRPSNYHGYRLPASS